MRERGGRIGGRGERGGEGYCNVRLERRQYRIFKIVYSCL